MSFKTTLLGVMGISPAILTETVWVLAQEGEIPDEVVVLTTSAGKEALVRSLLEQKGWQRLLEALAAGGVSVQNRLRFGGAADHIRLFPRADGRGNLRDLISGNDHRAAGDFILRALRGYTEDPETRVIASLAGGRKTMSALLTSCMTLLARRRDRLCHVLVNPPYDQPRLSPLFLFPRPGIIHRLPGDETAFPSDQARIELVDVPFVRLRDLYESRFRRLPPSFSSLVDRVQRMARPVQDFPEIVLVEATGEATAGGRKLGLNDARFALLRVIAGRLKRGRPWSSWYEIGQELERLRERPPGREDPEWLHEFCRRRLDPKEDIRKWASALRRRLRAQLDDPGLVEALLPDLKSGQRACYPASRIRIERR